MADPRITMPIVITVSPETIELLDRMAAQLARISEALAPSSAPEGWPFKPGDVVRDSGEDADNGAWLEAAPAGVVVVGDGLEHWRRTPEGWFPTYPSAVDIVAGAVPSHDLEAKYGPMTVVSVPGEA